MIVARALLAPLHLEALVKVVQADISVQETMKNMNAHSATMPVSIHRLAQGNITGN